MKSVLVLEDDRTLNKGISILLQKEGYRVLSAFCMKEAQQLVSGEVDLIISDITLPDGNGMDFCRELRNKCSVYLIYLTALDQETDIVTGYDSGADDYITKPISLAVLISKVNALMRRLEEKDSSILISGSIILNTENMQVMKNQKDIGLSKKEFQILKLLMENQGKIVSKEMILESVWSMDGQFVDDNTVAVNISRLKNKLDTKVLANSRGVGYIWTEAVTKR